MNCPQCFAQLRRFRPWQPGQMTVCQACGVVLRVNDSYAVCPARPEEITAQPPALFNRLLTASCRALAGKISARSGATASIGTPASAVERPARSGLLERVK
jgi:hypothetical protein